MNTSLRLHVLAGLAVGLATLNAWAAESVVYRFQDGTVTVTPRASSKVDSSNTDNQPHTVPALHTETIDVNPGRGSLRVLPVSLKQQIVPPKPDELIPPVNTIPEAPVSVQQVAVPQSIPAMPELQPGCCGEPIITPRSQDVQPRSTVTLSTAALYADVYKSIPFSRVEYNHYPNYRHDATMEFLFNQMRNTIINRNTGYAGYDYTYGPAYGYLGYPYYDPPAYPFSYGLRIHRSR